MQYYFEITTESAEQLASLKSDLRDLGVTAVNVGAAYEQENEEEKQDAASGLYLYLLVIVLLLIIYFFIEKSASIKNSKEYGIYRAIGVNKGNFVQRVRHGGRSQHFEFLRVLGGNGYACGNQIRDYECSVCGIYRSCGGRFCNRRGADDLHIADSVFVRSHRVPVGDSGEIRYLIRCFPGNGFTYKYFFRRS